MPSHIYVLHCHSLSSAIYRRHVSFACLQLRLTNLVKTGQGLSRRNADIWLIFCRQKLGVCSARALKLLKDSLFGRAILAEVPKPKVGATYRSS